MRGHRPSRLRDRIFLEFDRHGGGIVEAKIVDSVLRNEISGDARVLALVALLTWESGNKLAVFTSGSRGSANGAPGGSALCGTQMKGNQGDSLV